MTLLAVERIKLLSTRSPWWCAVASVVLAGSFTALVVGNATPEFPATVAATQFGYQLALAVIMVLGALSVTTEYRFNTIRTTFQAVPNRTAVLVAKATVVALLALLIGELTAFSSWGLSLLLAPDYDLALDSTADVVNVVGVGPVFAVAAVIAVAVGLLVRHSAGAISLLMIYTLAAESLVQLVPRFGDDIYQWLPFNVAHKFLTGDGESSGGAGFAGPPLSTSQLSPGWAFAYFAAIGLGLLIIAIVTTNKRDA
ncbi:ABC transporter permease [Saccharomonospora sp. NB11]|jgi:ABC-2 type transport system permease protein|uniref:ABC transporter permease n=1 Tax=Saccharomonospora sp. NB11 TaxID=1642298 RepID=UPI0018D1E5C3|nr:ABC transporter permease [Saccharomonospora sp. NB11]